MLGPRRDQLPLVSRISWREMEICMYIIGQVSFGLEISIMPVRDWPSLTNATRCHIGLLHFNREFSSTHVVFIHLHVYVLTALPCTPYKPVEQNGHVSATCHNASQSRPAIMAKSAGTTNTPWSKIKRALILPLHKVLLATTVQPCEMPLSGSPEAAKMGAGRVL